jgi:hypothetical protein
VLIVHEGFGLPAELAEELLRDRGSAGDRGSRIAVRRARPRRNRRMPRYSISFSGELPLNVMVTGLRRCGWNNHKFYSYEISDQLQNVGFRLPRSFRSKLMRSDAPSTDWHCCSRLLGIGLSLAAPIFDLSRAERMIRPPSHKILRKYRRQILCRFAGLNLSYCRLA